VFMKIESKVCASVSCVLATGPDDVRINEHARPGKSIPVFVGQHEPESAEASGIVEYS